LFCADNFRSTHGGSPLQTECTSREFGFQSMESRQVTARFDGGMIASDAGAHTSDELAAVR
jgi:hypothetical protein